MKIGVLLSTRNAVTGTRSAAKELEALISIAAQLDEAGVDSLWVGDSLLGRPRPEPLSLLAAIGARTRSARLGTATLLPAMRHPLQLAQQLATLDLLSGGRLVVGVGTGFPNQQTRLELEALGLDYGRRVSSCHESVAWCRSFWGGAPPAPGAWDLRNHRVQPLPVQPSGPRFWLGGATPRTCRRVGLSYDGWMPTSPSPEAYRVGWSVVAGAAREVERDPEFIEKALVLTVAVDDEEEVARSRLERYMETYYSARFDQIRGVVGCCSGSLSSVLGKISAFRSVGVEHLILRFAGSDQSEQIGRWFGPLLAGTKAD